MGGGGGGDGGVCGGLAHFGELCIPSSLSLETSFFLLFSEKMFFNSPRRRYIWVSSFKGRHFFTLIIHAFSLCV